MLTDFQNSFTNRTANFRQSDKKNILTIGLPQTRRHTTLWNIIVRKAARIWNSYWNER